MKANHPLPIKFAVKKHIPMGNAEEMGYKKVPLEIKG